LSLSLSGYFISREIIAYRQYNDAYYVSDSTALWQTVEDARRKALALGVTGGALLATSAVLAILMPKPKALSGELAYIDARIKSIEELLAQ
jgi:cysteine synthase